MIKKIMIAIATLAMAFSIMVAGSKPASADECSGTLCGTIVHASDSGYDADIVVRCTYGVEASKRWVPEGRSSASYCRDTDQVFVRTNEEIWCGSSPSAPKGKTFDAQGWHKINNLFYRWCVVQRD